MTTADDKQRVLAAVERAGDAVAPVAMRELERTFGPSWLDRVNARREAEGRPAGRGMHDPRFVLSLVGFEPALEGAFNADERRAAKRLNGMGNAALHNDPEPSWNGDEAEKLAQVLARHSQPAQAPPPAGYAYEPDPTGRAAPQPDAFGSRPSGPSGPRAGFWMRFGAALIDGILFVIVLTPLQIALSTGAYNVIATLGGIAYYVLLEGGARGQTVGKMALGIRVFDFARGGPIGYGRAFIRYIGRILSLIVFLLGYLWMLWDREKQTWHDKFAGSVVVPVSAYPVG